MAYELNGKTIEATEDGYLLEVTDWSEELVPVMAQADGIELTDRHMDVVNYLRSEHVNNAGNEPNERTIMKDMGKKWGSKVSSKDMFILFPFAPSKQGRKWAGLPKSTRKGGY